MPISTTILSTLLLLAAAEASSLAKRDVPDEPPSGDSSDIGPGPECCLSKTVGSYNYTQVSIGRVPATCISNCIYTRVGAPGSRFCFATGPEEVHCLNKGGITTTPVDLPTTKTSTTPTRPGDLPTTGIPSNLTTPTLPTTTTIPPIRTILKFVENNIEFEQNNAFHEDTDVLKLVVPAHANYTETQFVIHETGVLLKTNGTCSISPIVETYNVSSHHNSYAKEMERRLQNSNNRLEDEPKYHILKIRQERVGHKERMELHPAHSSACDDEPIVKTEEQTISEEQFKMIEAGEFITVSNITANQTSADQQNKRQAEKSDIVKVCSTGGPKACGRGFTNPVSLEYFSFHQISYGTLCVWCCIVAPPPASFCPNTAKGKLCDCRTIVDKNSFMACRLDDTPVKNQIPTDGNGRQAATLTTQTLTFQKKSDGRDISIKVEMPAHTSNGRRLKKMTVIMNADEVGAWHPFYTQIKNNMMTKIGDDCQVRTLPADMFPVNIALGLEEIRKPSVPQDDIDRHFINRQLDDADVSKLHPLVQETCPNGVKFTQPKPISKEDSEMLSNGGVVFFEERLREVHSNLRQSCRGLTTKISAVEKASGCWRRPNDNGTELYVHDISTTVEELRCCEEVGDDCCDEAVADGLYKCKCSDIKDNASFKKCSG